MPCIFLPRNDMFWWFTSRIWSCVVKHIVACFGTFLCCNWNSRRTLLVSCLLHYLHTVSVTPLTPRVELVVVGVIKMESWYDLLIWDHGWIVIKWIQLCSDLHCHFYCYNATVSSEYYEFNHYLLYIENMFC